MTERKRLTDAIVRRLPLPAAGKAITIDADVPGFGARVTANGARSYVLRYTTRAGRERTYPSLAALSRPQEHSAHRPIHRTFTRPLPRLLARLVWIGAPSPALRIGTGAVHRVRFKCLTTDAPYRYVNT